jgi:hypothetical protein
MNARALKDGVVSRLIGDLPLPQFYKIRQVFKDKHIGDISAEVVACLERPGTLDRIKAGQRIAIAVGSRGISNLAQIVKTIAACVKQRGGQPFIVPAMGSHGGATAEGQAQLIKDYGISEKSIGCPIVSCMEVVELGKTQYGVTAYFDACAYQSDGVILLNRIKPHTDYRGRFESGLMKQLTIGLGKQKGAEACHAQSMKHMARNIETIGSILLEKANVLFGIGIVENAYEKTMALRAIPAQNIWEEEPALLVLARRHMPSILLSPFDVLIVDEIGKNISGNGMDPNITGCFAGPYASGGADKQKCVVLDITEQSHGNGLGLGLADYTVARAFEKFSFEMTYPNVITNTTTSTGKLPLVLANDLLAIRAAIKTCNMIDTLNPEIVRIKNTLSMEYIYISQALYGRAASNHVIEVLEGPLNFVFDSDGNIDFEVW